MLISITVPFHFSFCLLPLYQMCTRGVGLLSLSLFLSLSLCLCLSLSLSLSLYLGLNSVLCIARQALFHLSQTSSPFYSGYFRDKVSLFARASLDHSPSTSRLPTVTGMTGVHHCTQLLVEIGWSHELLLPRLALNCDPPDLSLPSR
jgi:hypothetical protein